jgi:lauroyl/myristoyl acyltransferase
VTQQMVDIFERFVRRYPDQWYVFRDMWPGEG